MGGKEGDGELHGFLTISGQIFRGKGGLAVEESVVQRDVAGIPYPRLKGALRIAQSGRLANIAILERGGCSEGEIVPAATAVTVRKEVAQEGIGGSRAPLQAGRGEVKGRDKGRWRDETHNFQYSIGPPWTSHALHSTSRSLYEMK